MPLRAFFVKGSFTCPVPVPCPRPGTGNHDVLTAIGARSWPAARRKAPAVPGPTATGDGYMPETLYEHAGGDEALHRLEELFYARALADPVLKDVFTERVATHGDPLTWFTAESFGGPARFTGQVGFQYLIDVHRHREITDEQRDRFVALYL